MAFGLKNLFGGLAKKTLLKPTSVVGIDFGSASIKVVELKLQDEVLTLSTYGELQLGPYGAQDLGVAVQLPAEKRIEALVDVLRESKVQTKNGVFVLQLSGSFITVFSLHTAAHEDIGPRVAVEARKYIPIPMTDVSLDWTPLPAVGAMPENVQEVLVVAVQNSAQAELLSLKQAVAMTAGATEIELFSALRAVGKAKDTSVAIIDIGAQTSKLYIAQDVMIRKIHRVYTGGTEVTKKIAQVLQVSFAEAEDMKRNYSSEDTNAETIKNAFRTSFERSMNEFKRVIHQYEARSGEPVARIVLTGGSACFPDMGPFVKYVFDREVEFAQPFAKVAYPAFMEDLLTEIGPLFSVALGAALRTLSE